MCVCVCVARCMRVRACLYMCVCMRTDPYPVQVTEADHARWLEGAQRNFRAYEEMTKSNPVNGLLGNALHRRSIISKITDIRQRQREIFVDQFKQVPGEKSVEAESESYSAIWEDFKVSGQQVEELVRKLDSLSQHIDTVNKAATDVPFAGTTHSTE